MTVALSGRSLVGMQLRHIAVGLVSLILVACGGDDSASGPSGSGGTSSGGASSGGASTGGGAGSGGGAGTSTGGNAGSGGNAGGASGSGGGSGSGGIGGGGSGLIQVDSNNPAWLRYQGAGSHFLCAPGDPEGFLYRGTRNPDGTRTGDQATLISKLAPTGANGIYLMAVRSHGGDGGPTENPFVDSDPTKGLDQDILKQWETWFSAMDKAGIVIYFFFYDDSARIWNTGDGVGAAEKKFVEDLVNRFEKYDHLVWVVGEEYSERYSKARASAIAATIRAADDRKHVIGVHQLGGLDFDFPNDPNIDQFTIQYNQNSAAQLHSGMVQAFKTAAGKYNLNMSEAANYGSGATARQKSWATAMGGAYVMILGMDIASTPVADLEDCGRLRNFMEAAPLSDLSVHDELAAGATQYVLADPGSSYVVYAANAQGDLGLKGMTAGTYDLQWFEPATGKSQSQAGVSVAAGEVTFSTPSGFGAELALRVTKK